MKTRRDILICVFCSLFALNGMAQKKDPLGATEEELDRLKQLNASNKVTPLSDAELRQLMAGTWTTGRHVYEYNPDGTWRMLPADVSTTKGTWRIENHQLIEGTSVRTILEASHKQFTLKNDKGAYPYRYARLEKK